MKKNLLYIGAVAMLLAGCQEKWEAPAPIAPANEQDIVAEGYTLMTVNDFKQKYFYDELPEPKGAVKAVVIPDKVYLKTKVISSDEQGNTYRSLYVQDYTGWQGGAIELKIGLSSLYNTYKPGQIVYVKADELSLGNYRWMLSLGGPSVEEKYSNGYISMRGLIDAKILRGEREGLTAADTLVINSSNVTDYCNTVVQNNYDGTYGIEYLGCLVRFEGIESYYGSISRTENNSFNAEDVFPSYLWSQTVNGQDLYQEYNFTDPHYIARNSPYKEAGELPVTWAYCYPVVDKEAYEDATLYKATALYNGVIGAYESFYGSTLFLFTKSIPFTIRTSAYSRFALNEIPANGTKVDLTAILTKYCSSGGGYTKYQLVLNSDKDVVVRK